MCLNDVGLDGVLVNLRRLPNLDGVHGLDDVPGVDNGDAVVGWAEIRSGVATLDNQLGPSVSGVDRCGRIGGVTCLGKAVEVDVAPVIVEVALLLSCTELELIR